MGIDGKRGRGMNDLIEREDAIRAVGEAWGKAYRVIDALKSIPSAERKGEWIEQHENGHGFWVGVCSQCGEEKLVDNYCPNCGADMREEDDGR